MRGIINVERKRILNLKTFTLFITIILLYSVSGTYYTVKNYDIRDQSGVVVPWNENLKYGKAATKGKNLDEDYFASMIDVKRPYIYMDEMNLNDLVEMNYGMKEIKDLTKKEIIDFYSIRQSRIKEILDESFQIQYTENEKAQFMKKANELNLPLSMDYSEGWKNLNQGMEKFVPILLIVIAIILLPIFGREPQTKMKELYRSTKYGKKKLDRAKVIVAYPIGIGLYFVGIIMHFTIKMLPFGFGGGNQPIQSHADTFFSLYNITNLQQFLINVGIGLVAMVFIISLVLLITVLTEGIMTGGVIIIFFWILLLSFDQVRLYEIDHFFANFMPLRMTKFSHYYVGNEIYRIAGNSIVSMNWVLIISGILSVMIVGLSVLFSDLKRSKNLKMLTLRKS